MTSNIPSIIRPPSSASSPFPAPSSQTSNLLLPATTSRASVSLQRQGSRSSQVSARVPSPRQTHTMLPPLFSASASATSSASTSKTGSFITTPKLLSRRSSAKEKASTISRRGSQMDKGVQKDRDSASTVGGNVKGSESIEGWRSPLSESGSAEVIETPELRMDRDPETGRRMMNQYLVLQEIGHGTHGQVRLGRDMSGELPPEEEGDLGLGLHNNAYYAIKIVDRNPRKKRLTGFSRQKGLLGRGDGGKMLNENEIRKEIAIFKKVNHPNVVRMREIIDDPISSKVFMVLEYCEGGEIIWKGKDGLAALTVDESRRIFRDTLLGLEYLHHQGIIHRDIKPSNLLYASDKTVKISDFGCSHYSGALRDASAHLGADGEAYVDDIELAKTAGSPAFFAPEMCYSGMDSDIGLRKSPSLIEAPVQENSAFNLRPPSNSGDFGDTRASRSDPVGGFAAASPTPLRTTLSNESTLSRRPLSARTQSSGTASRRERLPITNAIDVWALGVTLYCLLFGKTPFDAPNEYLLMQIIPTAEYEIPPFMGSDRLFTGSVVASPASADAMDALDLLRGLLEKHPSKRITLEMAKKHPYTLRGIADPSTWLASTDPYAQTFVTVSNDEVAAVITKSSSFKDKFRKSIKSISHKLQIFGGGSRNRSRSIGDADTKPTLKPSAVRSAGSSQIFNPSMSKPTTAVPRLPPGSRHTAPMNTAVTPAPAMIVSRRFSLLGARHLDSSSPNRQQSISSATPDVNDTAVPLSVPSFGNRPVTQALPAAQLTLGNKFMVESSTTPSGIRSHPTTATEPVEGKLPIPFRSLASSSSLDKLKSPKDQSPTSSLRRRQSCDIDGFGRQLPPEVSLSTSNGIGSKLGRLLSGTRRSRFLRRDKASGHLEVENFDELAEKPLRVHAIQSMSLDDGMPRQSLETFDSESYSPRLGPVATDLDRLGGLAWQSRLNARPGVRRGSSMSEEFSRGVAEEEVDWSEPISDEEEEVESTSLPLKASMLEVRSRHQADEGLPLDPQTIPYPQSSALALSPAIGVSPESLYSSTRGPAARSSRSITSPTSIDTSGGLQKRSSLRGNPHSPSPYRTGNEEERRKSSLSRNQDDRRSASRPQGNRQTSDSWSDQNDEDEGLAISVGSRRGRKGSMRPKASSLIEQSPD